MSDETMIYPEWQQTIRLAQKTKEIEAATTAAIKAQQQREFNEKSATALGKWLTTIGLPEGEALETGHRRVDRYIFAFIYSNRRLEHRMHIERIVDLADFPEGWSVPDVQEMVGLASWFHVAIMDTYDDQQLTTIRAEIADTFDNLDERYEASKEQAKRQHTEIKNPVPRVTDYHELGLDLEQLIVRVLQMRGLNDSSV